MLMHTTKPRDRKCEQCPNVFTVGFNSGRKLCSDCLNEAIEEGRTRRKREEREDPTVYRPRYDGIKHYEKEGM